MNPIKGYLHFKYYIGKKRERGEIDGSGSVDLVDFVLKPLDSNAELLLSFPRNLLRMAAEASQMKVMVRITRYSLTPFLPHRIPCTAMIEVFSDGLELCLENTRSTFQEGVECNDVWNLAQVARLEALDALENSAGNKMKFTIEAIIRAVSPLITADPADAFALIELTDDDDDLCCICVLRLHALSHLRALRPGDRIQVKDVRRIKWDVPLKIKQNEEELESHPIPQYVFLVQHSEQIVFFGALNGSLQPTITGYIKQVHRVRYKGSNHIHYLELVASKDSNALTFLFLTYFPMPISLQLSLKQGAVICAFNLKQIDSNCWAAGIRSTVDILKAADESIPHCDTGEVSNQHISEFNRSEESFNLIPFSSPYLFRSIRQTFQELWVRKLVRSWIAEFHVPQSEVEVLPTIDSVTTAVMPTVCRRMRDPFVEFFDTTNNLSDIVPRFATVHNLYEVAVTELEDRLKRYLDTLDGELFVGWTGSFVLDGRLPGRKQ